MKFAFFVCVVGPAILGALAAFSEYNLFQ